MVLFLTGFFFIYGLMHFYFMMRAKSALHLEMSSTLPLALVMIIMIVSPIIVRLLESAGAHQGARVVAYVGYTWMGLLFVFVCSSLLIDLYRVVIYLLDRLTGSGVAFLTVRPRAAFMLAGAVVIAVGLYGSFEARSIRNDTITITTTKLSADLGRLRIVQISDVHLGLVVGEERLRRIVAKVKNAQPDIVVSTGDLVDGLMDHHKADLEILKSINPRYGKFAVTGNHEYYAGLGQALNFTTRAGFRVLRGETVTIKGVVNIAGVDDPAGPGFVSSSKGEKEVLAAASNGAFMLLLKHRPAIDKESLGLLDLQLSGHVHKGQIFPFRFITRLFYPFISGLHHLPHDSMLYVNRGSGTWGPPIRFLAPPEVTVIDIVHAPSGR
jgi:predicted MPP superfamily phosphohydrolase